MPASNMYDRALLVGKLRQETVWDVIIIGGGATGLGTALDAASRGFKTLLLEQHDFAKGTSSRSTKLIHGGVRYLAQGDLKLVYSALHERNVLARNAAHVVKRQSFVIPCYTSWELLKYGSGLKLYDLLAGRYSLGRSRFLSKASVLKKFPLLSSPGLKGGIEYFDGQFDDARLAINIAQTAIEKDAVVLNYFKVSSLVKEGTRVEGVVSTDCETGEQFTLRSRVVINATGVFVDDILQMDEARAAKLVTPSQGVHVVVSKKYIQGESALMIPQTSDGRVLFAVPWHNQLVVGTTDTPLEKNSLEPLAAKKDVDFILENFKKYIPEPLAHKDILSVFAGLRPLASVIKSENGVQTKELSRDHKLIVGRSGLITITGGKWTTYRKMAEETVNAAINAGSLPAVNCNTEILKLHGCSNESKDRLSIYGTDGEHIRKLINQTSGMDELLVSGHPFTAAEVIWAVRWEMARTVEDVLARRTRLLFLDAKAAIEAAPRVAVILQEELGLTNKQISMQLDEFYKIAAHYKLNQ